MSQLSYGKAKLANIDLDELIKNYPKENADPHLPKYLRINLQ